FCLLMPSSRRASVRRAPSAKLNRCRSERQPDQSSSGLHREALGKSRPPPAQTLAVAREGIGSEPEEDPLQGASGRPFQAPADTPTGEKARSREAGVSNRTHAVVTILP